MAGIARVFAGLVARHQFQHAQRKSRRVGAAGAIGTDAAERIQRLEDLGQGLFLVVAAYGFMQLPDVIETLELCAEAGLKTNVNDRSFYLGRETLVISDRKGMARWRKILFAYLSRNARPASAFFQIPSNRVVELGTHIEL